MRPAVLTACLLRSSTPPFVFDDGVGAAGVCGSVGLAELSPVAYAIVLALPDERSQFANGRTVI